MSTSGDLNGKRSLDASGSDSLADGTVAKKIKDDHVVESSATTESTKIDMSSTEAASNIRNGSSSAGVIGSASSSTGISSSFALKANISDSDSSLPNRAVPSDVSFRVVRNDGTNENNIALITLKNIFSRQLPKMPKEYIVRLVMDKRHISLAICRSGRIIGGICYRPYNEQRFGEIAFCAVSGTEQVRGFGTLLMNELKCYVQKDRLEYFLTYADNYAIGYFQKQGFSKNIAMPKERWVGYIKDYDGGTLMECYIHPGMDYHNVSQVVAKQRSFIYEQIRLKSQSGVVYPGLEMFNDGGRLQSVMEAPGVQAAGWTQYHLFKGTERDRNMTQSRLASSLKNLLDKLFNSKHAWPFEAPVSREEHPEYYETIKNPLSLKDVSDRLKLGDYYRCKEQMMADLMLMVENCKTFNEKETDYHDAALQMEATILALFEGENKDGSTGGTQ